MAHKTISYTDNSIYTFTPELEAALTVDPNEKITIETIDSLEKEVVTSSDLLHSIPDEVNAATGPIAIRGAQPGDILSVKIEEIRITEESGRVVTTDGFGLLDNYPEIESPRTKITPVSGESILFDEVEIPIKPVIGTIGVATKSDSYSTLVPHNHGGNLDTTDITTGSTVYFPVFQSGAMLAMGDCKAAMADGEMCGTGSEIATEIDVTVDIIKTNQTISRPIVETADSFKTLASAETLEAACELANLDLIELIKSEHMFDSTEAHMFSSLVGGLEISQVVDPLVTVRNSIPKKYLTDPFN